MTLVVSNIYMEFIFLTVRYRWFFFPRRRVMLMCVSVMFVVSCVLALVVSPEEGSSLV